MGFNTVAVLLNDHWNEIEKSGPVGARLGEAMRNYPSEDWLATWFGSGRVISMAHADYWQVTVVGANTGYRLGDTVSPPPASALEAVARDLRRHGYKVTKPKAAHPLPAPVPGGG